MSTPIKAIIHIINHYPNHLATFNNVALGTRESIRLEVGGPSNARILGFRAFNDWEPVYVVEYDVSSKMFRHAIEEHRRTCIQPFGLYENDESRAAVIAFLRRTS
jgi:hypothetical protein